MDTREEAIELFLKATEFMNAGRLNEALDVFYKVEPVLSEVPAVYYNKCQILSRMQNWGAAIENIDIALSLDPNNVNYLRLKLKILQQLSKFTESIKVAEQILQLEMDPKIAANLGFLYLKHDMLDKAQTIFEDLILAGQADPIIYFILGIMKYQSAQLEEAEELLKHVIDLDYNVDEATQVLVSTYEKAGKIESAIGVLENRPIHDKELKFQLAKMYKKNDQIAETTTLIDDLLRSDPDNTQYLTLKGHLLREEAQFEQALNFYDRVLQQNPEDLSSIKGKALCLVELDRPEEANEWFEKGERINRGGDLPNFEDMIKNLDVLN